VHQQSLPSSVHIDSLDIVDAHDIKTLDLMDACNPAMIARADRRPTLIPPLLPSVANIDSLDTVDARDIDSLDSVDVHRLTWRPAAKGEFTALAAATRLFALVKLTPKSTTEAWSSNKLQSKVIVF
jgi:hypothetical protein